MTHYHHRFHVSVISAIVVPMLAFTVGVFVLVPFGPGGRTPLVFEEPATLVVVLAAVGMLVVAWSWSVRGAMRSVRVDDDGIWVAGDRVVRRDQIRAVGVIEEQLGPGGFSFVGPPAGAGLLTFLGSWFSPAGWERRLPLPDGDTLVIPGAQDVGGRTAWVHVVVVLDGYAKHRVRQGWAFPTWRGAELLAAIERIAPDAERLGSQEDSLSTPAS